MGMHLVALAKLKLTLVASHGLAPILAGGLIWPFLLKLSLALQLSRRNNYADVVQASSLFFFQLRQIVVESERPVSPAHESRLRRAVRLVCRRMASVWRSVAAAQGSGGGGDDADSLHTLSMIAL
ncbi:hypothetical protein ACJRO7_019492 [Eucalyptus globulus]|uniref:Uncharacterized protein n=1 Tax=Eucalyptus globulus TaxID=34317 RepID=A0ABD3KDC1_EUCGL